MLKIERNTNDLIFDGKRHSRAYFGDKEVWRKMYRIYVDHSKSLDGVLEGVYDRGKKGYIVTSSG